MMTAVAMNNDTGYFDDDSSGYDKDTSDFYYNGSGYDNDTGEY